MSYRLVGYSEQDEFRVYCEDYNTNQRSVAMMSKDVLVDLITKNIDRLTYFEIGIDGTVEYIDMDVEKTVSDERLEKWKQEMTD